MTLVELILALLLLNVVILTGISMELGMRRIYTSTDVEAQLLAEAAPIIALVTKDINRAFGDSGSAAFIAGGNTYSLRNNDSNFNGRADSFDKWAAYRFIPGTHQLLYYPDNSSGTNEVLSNKVMSFTIDAAQLPTAGTLTVTLTLRKDPSSAPGYTNPEISVNSAAQLRGFPLG